MPTDPISRRGFVGIAAAGVAGAALPDLATRPVHHAVAPPRLIVRGDDMGYAHAGNDAIIECFVYGVESSIEVLAPSPWFPHAASLLAEHAAVDVGVHLTLTSEWDNIKWRPLTPAPSLRDADGYFFPMLRPNPNYPRRSVAEQQWVLADVERELRAQIELVKRHVPRVSHLSGHMGCTSLSPDVTQLVRRLGAEYGVGIRPEELGVLPARYDGAHATSSEKVESFLRMLDRLEAGKAYLFVDHPGRDGPELRAIHHVGYEQVATDRQGVTDCWTSPRVRERVRTRGIQLIGYRDLVR